MTKKDYVLIADCIKNVINHAKLDEQQASVLITNFSSVLSRENSKFNSQKFFDYINYFSSEV